MSKLNRSPRRFTWITRMCTIVRPDIAKNGGMSGTAYDYVDVSVISTYGQWPIVRMLSDSSMLNLAKFYASKGVRPK